MANEIPPAVDEEDDVCIRNLGLSLIVLEGVEIDGDALGRPERGGVEEEGVWVRGGRSDVDADRHVRREMRWIWLSSAFVYRLGDARRD